MERRSFLLVATAAAAGLYFGAGLVALPRTLVLQLQGTCAFCGEGPEDGRLFAGRTGSRFRLCSECVSLCTRLVTEMQVLRAAPLLLPPDPVEVERILEELRLHVHTPDPPRTDPLTCAFCDRAQREVGELVAGPGFVCVCDACTYDAATLLGAWSRA